ncbi:thioesterase family protein [Henriciella mobilis]|uniref:Thioesterase n=1 Tax=Henriciella mobilis TaxID=2305467 RepID=A0A399REB7_9PROT|nr:thioesterase family protein [Henriciella mobilis]RIJ28225.1 thioesterase [Henriciella mobilis]
MNLFLRLVLTFLRASFSTKRASLFDTTEIRSRVMLTDQDMFSHMTNSRYFSFSDLGIINYVVRTGAWKQFRKRGWFPVVCAESVTFAGMLRAHQTFSVETRLVGWSETYLCLEHRFLHKASETARVCIVARIASRSKEKVTIDDLVKLLGVSESSPPLGDTYLGLISDVEAARARKREMTEAR